MCWLHPGLAFKLPCVLLSLFMISVTLASLPCHFTNCCWGVYGQVPFPNVSDFSGACPETISFYGVVTEMVFFYQGKASLLPACVCLQKLCVCKARQDSSITAGRMEEVTASHPLTHSGKPVFCGFAEEFLGQGRQKKIKKTQVPSWLPNLSLVESKLGVSCEMRSCSGNPSKAQQVLSWQFHSRLWNLISQWEMEPLLEGNIWKHNGEPPFKGDPGNNGA